MSKIESYAPGAFCWAELATSDAESARRFYGEMFGWTVRENPFPGGVYLIFLADGMEAGAAYTARPENKPHWNVYFNVENVDATTAKVEPAGGKVVMPPFDVMGAGRTASIQDPQGAGFYLWQKEHHIGATYGGPLNMVSWAELATPDPAGAVAFYTGLLGWKAKPDTDLDNAQYIEWTINGKSFSGLIPMRGDMWKGVPPHWMIYVTVANCDERAAKAKELGATICVPPTDIPNVGRFAVINDAQGATFSIIQMTHAM